MHVATEGNLTTLPCRPPGEQAFFCLIGAERAFFDSQFEQVVVGLANIARRLQIKDAHDVFTTQVWAHGVQLLLLGNHGDSLFEIVVGVREAIGLALVSGGHVGAG